MTLFASQKKFDIDKTSKTGISNVSLIEFENIANELDSTKTTDISGSSLIASFSNLMISSQRKYLFSHPFITNLSNSASLFTSQNSDSINLNEFNVNNCKFSVNTNIFCVDCNV